MKTFDTLPPECVLPPGVEWCKEPPKDGEEWGALFRWYTDEDAIPKFHSWQVMEPHERCYAAARCAMWWERKALDNAYQGSAEAHRLSEFHNNEAAWKRLWRELEGV